MTLRETALFIREPIAALVAPDRVSRRPAVLRDGAEVAYLFGGNDLSSADFGLTFDPDADGEWTQLLHRAPFDVEALTESLRELGVDANRVDVSTGWDGTPLLDIGSIRDALRLRKSETKSGRAVARASGGGVGSGKAIAPDIGRHWIIIDADGLKLDHLASIAAERFNRPASKRAGKRAPVPFVERMLIMNASKIVATDIKLRAQAYLLRRFRHSTSSPSDARAVRLRLRLVENTVVNAVPHTRSKGVHPNKPEVYAGVEFRTVAKEVGPADDITVVNAHKTLVAELRRIADPGAVIHEHRFKLETGAPKTGTL